MADEVEPPGVGVLRDVLGVLVHEPAHVPLSVPVQQERSHRKVAVLLVDDSKGAGLACWELLDRVAHVVGPAAVVADTVHDVDDALDGEVFVERLRVVRAQRVDLAEQRVTDVPAPAGSVVAFLTPHCCGNTAVIGAGKRDEYGVLDHAEILRILTRDNVVTVTEQVDHLR